MIDRKKRNTLPCTSVTTYHLSWKTHQKQCISGASGGFSGGFSRL